VLKDAIIFRRKRWQYLILDEAHHIKNFRSQRWQTLLSLNAAHRLLLTGTPLQNNLIELWSLMHFLMPQIFASHTQFKLWFSKPMEGFLDGVDSIDGGLVRRLHSILRPFILRRLKRDVEQQLPPKFEHVVLCELSKRQKYLYEEFIANSDTRSVLRGGNYFAIANVLMQLRKVCNHPDLFAERPITSPLDCYPTLSVRLPRVLDDLFEDVLERERFHVAMGLALGTLSGGAVSEAEALRFRWPLLSRPSATLAAQMANALPRDPRDALHWPPVFRPPLDEQIEMARARQRRTVCRCGSLDERSARAASVPDAAPEAVVPWRGVLARIADGDEAVDDSASL
ncbi:MAG TPA: SNF2-related protein, partial [archaeon]|nr:SNF2-related protein [archaeon]